MGQVRSYQTGPFRADQIREGDRYELSNGHALFCAPGGPDHAARNLVGAAVLGSDPAVAWAGVDAGFSPEPKVMRAPDVSVGAVAPSAGKGGWAEGAPPLALEISSTGQDEGDLQDKIADLLGAGTRYVWVVRLVGPRRVDVYEPGKPVRTAGADAELTAPGVLANPVPVSALFDRDAAHAVVLRNLLHRSGYGSLDAVREEGRDEGRDAGREEGRILEARSALRRVLARRGLALGPEDDARIDSCRDLAVLERWLDEAIVAPTAAAALGV